MQHLEVLHMNWITVVSKLASAFWSACKAYKFLDESGLLKRGLEFLRRKKS